MQAPLTPRGSAGRLFNTWWEENQRTVVVVGAVIAGLLVIGTFGAIAKCARSAAPAVAVPSPAETPSPTPSPRRAPAPMTELERIVSARHSDDVRYLVKVSERIDSPQAARLSVRVTVPAGMSREELEQNIRHALMTSYDKSTTPLGAVTVLAYLDDGGSLDIEGPYTAAMGEFAPFGVWGKADASVPIRNWKVSIELAARYFSAPIEAIPVGAERILRNSSGGAVELSTTATQNPGDHVFSVPGGSRVRVKDVTRFEVGASTPLLRYEVELLDGTGRHGWANAYTLQAE